MRTKARGQWRADGRPASKTPRMPGSCTPRPELTEADLRVQALPISQIKFNPRNCKTHPGKQIRQIANSIVAFGFTHPLLVAENGELIAGEGRYKAAQLLGLAKVPVIVLAGLSSARRPCFQAAPRWIDSASRIIRESLLGKR